MPAKPTRRVRAKTNAQVADLNRIGIAIDDGLLKRFDAAIQQRGYDNRSEAVRDLVRASLMEETVATPDELVVGTLMLLYDHERRNLSDKLTHMQHDHHHLIISTMHVHLDHHNCVEVVVLRGRNAMVQDIANQMISTKGVLFGKLTLAQT